jgi:hypothetical protein
VKPPGMDVSDVFLLSGGTDQIGQGADAANEEPLAATSISDWSEEENAVYCHNFIFRLSELSVLKDKLGDAENTLEQLGHSIGETQRQAVMSALTVPDSHSLTK